MTSAARRRSLAVAAVALVLTLAPSPRVAEALTVVPVPLPGILPIPLTLCGSGGLPGDWSSPVSRGGSPLETKAPDYYAIELVAAGRVPGTRLSRGVALQTFASSPFNVSLAPSGEYAHHLDISVTGLKARDASVYAVWAATAELDRVVSLGMLDEDFRAAGQVVWNKFLVFITLEPAGAIGDTWTGPVILRGMSRSGRMHTMAGHGPFQVEPCVKYGY